MNTLSAGDDVPSVCKSDYVVNVSLITPYWMMTHYFIPYLFAVNAYISALFIHKLLDTLIYKDIIIFTSIRGAHHATTQERPQDQRFARTRMLTSSPGENLRRPVYSQRFLRPTRSVAGQVRDAAPCPGRRSLDQSGGCQLWPVAPVLLPSASGLRGGWPTGPVAQKPGPRRAHKLSEEIVEALRTMQDQTSGMNTAILADQVRERFGVSVHPRSIERALARQEKNSGHNRGVMAEHPGAHHAL